MSDAAGLTVEATGETVGEAKWAALRQLEQRSPGLDRAAVQFEVVSEGERGLLGVGYAPARVIAHVPAEAVDAREEEEPPVDESDLAADVRTLVTHITAGFGVPCRVAVVEDEEAVHVSCTGPDLGVLIGRHGQTIDSIQYLLNAIVFRSYGDARKEVVIDAAGYRERRREQLEALAVRSAEQARRELDRVELEPMTAVERKVVHLCLKDYDGVETSSEGTEPNRYVVIVPTA
ncbi:MAG TPA: RNA-binding cell elongation regulator Jag/EloR [Gaiellaceae bacterium]|jgi:spoIIIJ-associated protein